MVSYFQAALAGLHGKQIRASGFGIKKGGSKKQGGVKETTRGGQINRGGGQRNKWGVKETRGGSNK